jgi:hypothetical protein
MMQCRLALQIKQLVTTAGAGVSRIASKWKADRYYLLVVAALVKR